MRNGLLLVCGLWLIQAAADLDYGSTVSKLLSCWNVKSSTCQSQVSAALPVLAGVLEVPTTTVSCPLLLAAPVARVIMSHQHAGLPCAVLTKPGPFCCSQRRRFWMQHVLPAQALQAAWPPSLPASTRA